MASVALMPLPLLTMEGAESFLTIPGPWVLTVGSICLRNSIVPNLLVVSVLILLMLLFLNRRCANHQLRRRLLPLLLISLLLSGCAQNEEPVVWNRSTASVYENAQYLVQTGMDGATLTHKESGKTYDFPLDAAANITVTCGATLFGRGNEVWYLRTTTHQPSAGWDTIHTDSELVKLNLTTMRETVEFQWNEESEWFFGLLERESTPPNSFLFELLFVHGNKVYYLDSMENAVLSMDLLTGRTETILPSLNTQDLAYDGEKLYYLDSYNRLVIHDLNTGAKRAIDEVVAKDFLLTQDGIYFQNRRDNSAICFWDNAGNGVHIVAAEDAGSIFK